jgi:fructose-1,6-bisphosphatase/sedoheptulose 1,7-bisphosphatase-like protein
MSLQSLSNQKIINDPTNLLRATEAVALVASRHSGLGDEFELDRASTQAMTEIIESLHIEGKIGIGDLDGDLSDGSIIGSQEQSLVLRPIEGLAATALGGTNTLSLLGASDKQFPTIPKLYMEKVVVPPWASDAVDFSKTLSEILAQLAELKGVKISQLRVILLDRPRNQKILDEIREIGARITLIPDGDVAVSLAILAGQSQFDALVGSGGAREAVFTAIAAKAVGNVFAGRFLIRTREEENTLLTANLPSHWKNKVVTAEELAPGAAVLSATAITECWPLDGVSIGKNSASTHSFLFRSDLGLVRTIHTSHKLD